MPTQWIENLKSLSVAMSAIVVAIIAWSVQSTISRAGLQKDYVQIAVNILQQPSTSENQELRTWALAVIDESAPVPLSKTLRAQLESGTAKLYDPVPDPFVAEHCPPLTPLKDNTMGAMMEKLVEMAFQYRICRIAALGPDAEANNHRDRVSESLATPSN